MILQQFQLESLESETSQQLIKATVSKLFWTWYHYNSDKEIKIKKWFVNISVTISQLEPLFILLFGTDISGY